MRGMFGLVGIVVALALVAVLAARQLSPARAPVVVAPAGAAASAASAAGTVRAQSQQIQDQVRQQLEGALQQPRPMPGDENLK